MPPRGSTAGRASMSDAWSDADPVPDPAPDSVHGAGGSSISRGLARGPRSYAALACLHCTSCGRYRRGALARGGYAWQAEWHACCRAAMAVGQPGPVWVRLSCSAIPLVRQAASLRARAYCSSAVSAVPPTAGPPANASTPTPEATRGLASHAPAPAGFAHHNLLSCCRPLAERTRRLFQATSARRCPSECGAGISEI